MSEKLTALGRKVTKFEGLETFDKPSNVKMVTLISDEVSANCPVTEQPDWYEVRVQYQPKHLCAESKTVKLFFQSFRDQGHFCESFSNIIANQFYVSLDAHWVKCVVVQKPRGGVSIVSEAEFGEMKEL